MKNKICKCGHDEWYHREKCVRFTKENGRCTCTKFKAQEQKAVVNDGKRLLVKPKNHSHPDNEDTGAFEHGDSDSGSDKRPRKGFSERMKSEDNLSSKIWVEKLLNKSKGTECFFLNVKDVKESMKKLLMKAKSLDEFDGTYEVASEMMRRYIEQEAGKELLE